MQRLCNQTVLLVLRKDFRIATTIVEMEANAVARLKAACGLYRSAVAGGIDVAALQGLFGIDGLEPTVEALKPKAGLFSDSISTALQSVDKHGEGLVVLLEPTHRGMKRAGGYKRVDPLTSVL